VGTDIAVLDIAQDFLLAHLHERGVFADLVVFKGGTAIRKLFAGGRGRFSTDIDLSGTEPNADRRALAEKVARLSRLSTARDASDLVWAATTAPHSRFSGDMVRRVAVLKVWVDNHGLRPGWVPALAPTPFDPDSWFSPREPWDDEEVGLLAHPPPPLEQLEADLRDNFSWLRELPVEEARWANADPNDRGEVIDAIRSLDFAALRDAHIW